MKRNIYNLLSGAKHGLLALALCVFCCSAYAQNTYTFNYTGGQQTISLPAGTYTLETWGADGGENLGNGSTTYLQNGGKGGYSKGTYTLTTTTTIYVNVGGKGSNSTSTLNVTAPGGYNGGGYGSVNTASGKSSGAGGGGASHIATVTGTLGALASSSLSVLIVGGGGGGAGESNYASSNTSYNSNGGFGGGTSGLQNITSGYQGRHGQGGTQTAGGGGGDNGSAIAGVPLQGIFGAGGYNTTTNGNTSAGGSGAGGGGGGWFGGGSGWVGGTAYQAGSGGGGSGYIGGVSNGTTIVSGQSGFVTNPDISGNGLIIIKELCSISLLVNGVSGNTTICSGNSLSLTTNAVSNYSWSTGATTSSILVAPTTTTVYTLTATSSSNCVSSAQVTITVNNGLPTLTVANTASATSGICPTNSVTLTASGANTYTWAGASSVTNGVPFYPTTTSGYTVTGANACGTATAATSISIHPLPTTGTVISQPTVCSSSSVALTGVGNATTYLWSAGLVDGGPFFPQVTSSYTVTGYSAQGCTSSAVAFVTVVTTPVAQPLAGPPLVCIGNSSTLTALGATNYTWITPSATLNTSSITVTPNATTTYTITKANSNCVNTQYLTVIVNSLPPVNGIATPSIVCASKTLALQAIGGTTFTWTAPNYTSTSANPTVSPAGNTTYSLTASDGTCQASTVVQVLTNPNPTITIAPTSTSVCYGNSVTLVATGGDTYTWTTPTGTVSGDTVTQAPLSIFLYVVQGVNQHTCYSSSSQAMIVNPNPTLNIQTTKPLVCPGGVSSLTVTGAHTYSWDANAANATTTVVSVNPMVTTVYTVTGYYVPTLCNTSKTMQVNVFQPTFAVNSPTSSCKGGTINLIASGAISYTWNGNQPFSQIAVSPPTETVYIVSATSGSNGVNCISTQTVDVKIYANPTITAVSQRSVICNGEFVNLTGGGGTIYNWSSNQTGTVVAVNPKSTIIYNLTGTDQNGCVGTATVQVKVSPCIGIGEFNGAATLLSVFPNPNSGQFTVKSTTPVKFILHNELGQLIREVNLLEENNFEVQIGDLKPGVYFLAGDGHTEKIVVTH